MLTSPDVDAYFCSRHADAATRYAYAIVVCRLMLTMARADIRGSARSAQTLFHLMAMPTFRCYDAAMPMPDLIDAVAIRRSMLILMRAIIKSTSMARKERDYTRCALRYALRYCALFYYYRVI